MEEHARRDFMKAIGVGATIGTVASYLDGKAYAGSGEAAGNQGEQSSTFISSREDGRFLETAGFLQSYLMHLQPQLKFDPKMEAKKFPAWREAVRSKLLELMRFPEDVPEQPEPKKVWGKQRDGYELQEWEAYPEPYSVVKFLMLVPDGVSEQSPAPAVMCFPGSQASKESLAGEPELDTKKPSTWHQFKANRQALYYAQKGFVSVAIENPATNSSASSLRSRSELSHCAVWMGRNYLGISVFQKACILKWLCNLPHIDRKRIATSGHSLGSNPADILRLLYPDLINAVVHNDFVCNWQERAISGNCLPPGGLHHMVPGLFDWFDHTDLEASLAPCPLLFTEGGRTREIDRIRQAYRLAEAPGNIEVSYYSKFSTPEQRPFDDMDIPAGVTDAEYFQYTNVDPSKHRFRSEIAVPWLEKVFST